MNTKPLITIIVPVFNVERYIEKCVLSIINQTYTNLEIILVDDGSTDASGTICDKYARLDQRICVIHKANGGLVSARKAGSSIARGEYVLNVDGDDWIDENHINSAMLAIKHGVDMIFLSRFLMEYSFGNIDHTRCEFEYRAYYGEEIKTIITNLVDTNHFFRRNIILSLCLWLIKKELYIKCQNKVPDILDMGEDQICIMKCLFASNSVELVDGGGYHYVKFRDDSIVQSNKKKRAIKPYIEEIKKLGESYRDNYGENREVIHHYITHAKLSDGKYEEWFNVYDYLFPFKGVKDGDRIVVYGAGKVGQNYIRYLRKYTNICVVALADTNHKDEGVINDISKIRQDDYDYIIITVLDYDIANNIRSMLIEKGVISKKIKMMSV